MCGRRGVAAEMLSQAPYRRNTLHGQPSASNVATKLARNQTVCFNKPPSMSGQFFMIFNKPPDLPGDRNKPEQTGTKPEHIRNRPEHNSVPGHSW